jgi:hypothetical protein
MTHVQLLRSSFFIERGCLSKTEIGEREIYMHNKPSAYKLSGSVSRFHLGTAWRRGNTFWERSSAGLRRRQSGDSAEPK